MYSVINIIFILQKYLTKSMKDSFSKIRNDYFDTTKLIQLKIESNSWREQLNKVFSQNVVENISQYCKLQEGDMILLTIGRRFNAVNKIFFLILSNKKKNHFFHPLTITYFSCNS